jgi:hypothetical protein
MASVSDLKIERFDQAWAKGSHVLLRYTASGSHCGKPYKGIEKSDPPRKARWWAAAIFEIEGGKVKSFTKDWVSGIFGFLWERIAKRRDDLECRAD